MTSIAAKKAAVRGPRAVTVTQGRKQVPRLPAEHDESPDSQTSNDAKPTRVSKQAAKDVKRGLVDTSTGPVLERVSEQFKRTK